jgi:hypothetical protein
MLHSRPDQNGKNDWRMIMKFVLLITTALAIGSPAAFAGSQVEVKFSYASDRSTEDNYQLIESKATNVCRSATRRYDTFASTDTREILESCKSELVAAAVEALGVTELQDMYDTRS